MSAIIKPRSLGIMTKVEPRRGGGSLIVSTFGLFALAGGDGEAFMAEQGLWPLAAEQFPEGVIFDVGMPKPCGEVLAAGSATAPAGTAVAAIAVDVQIGSVGKRLAVFGDRFWQPGLQGVTFTPPKPFEAIQLAPARAFGGPDFPANAAGLGHDAARRVQRGELVALPNIEDPRRLIRSIDDVPPVSGFGPLDIMRPERAALAGTYDAEWLRYDAPGLPRDVDPRLFLFAPEDQRISGYFAGDEAFRVAGFSAEHAEITGRLPGFRSRVFVERTGAEAGLFELPMRIDTVIFFGSVAKGVIVSRGSIPVERRDGRDAATVLIAYERLTDPPRPVEHYAEQIRARRDPEQALKQALNDAPLIPERTPAARARRSAVRAAAHERDRVRALEAMALAIEDASRLSGVDLPPVDPNLIEAPPAFTPSREEISSGDFDIAELIDGLEALQAEAIATLDAEAERGRAAIAAAEENAATRGAFSSLDDILDMLEAPDRAAIEDALATPPPSMLPAEPGAPDGAAERASEARAALPADLRADLDAQIAAAAAATGPMPEDDLYAEAVARFLRLPEAGPLAAAIAGLDAVPLDQIADADRQAREALAKLPPNDGVRPFQMPELGALLDDIAGRPEVAASLGAAAKIADARDRLAAAQADIRRMTNGAAVADLPSSSDTASPIESLMAGLIAAGEPVDFASLPPLQETVGSSLAEARAQLVAVEADILAGESEARRVSPQPLFPARPLGPEVARRFGEAVLAQVAAGLSLVGRDLAGIDLAGADLSGLDLTDALLENADLTGATIAGSRCRGATFAGARLDGADFSGSDLVGVNLSGVTADGARFAGAQFGGQRIFGGTFRRTDFTGAVLDDVTLLETDLSGAVFDGARLTSLTALRAKLTGISAVEASFDAVILMETDLAGADLSRTRLLRVAAMAVPAAGLTATGATINRAVFVGQCDLTGARFDGCTLADVSMNTAQLAGADFTGVVAQRCEFGGIQARDTMWILAGLKDCLFPDAALTGADFFGAQAAGVQFRCTDLTGASLRAANLYTADFADAVLTACDLSRANLHKTLLELATDGA